MKPNVLALSILMACHPATLSGERVLDRGGDVALGEKRLEVTATTVSAWGVIEVPDGSRLQATYAGADAIARSELLKFVRVRIEDEMVSVDSTDPARQDAFEHTVETVSGALRRAGTTEHAWERVQRGDRRLLRVWSRVTVPRAEIEAALAR